MMPHYSNAQAADTLYATRFENSRVLKQWDGKKKGARILQTEGAPAALRLVSDKKGRRLNLPLDAGNWRGRKLYVRLRCKTANTAGPGLNPDAVKFFLIARNAAGRESWFGNGPDRAGNNSWEWIGFTALIPADARTLTFRMEVADPGELWIDDLQLYSPAALAFDTPVNTAPALKLRGAMVSPTVTAEDLTVLAGWGANHVRWQLTWAGFPNSPADTATLAKYRIWLAGALSYLDSMLPVMQSLGMKVVLDLHTPPGGRIPPYNRMRVFEDSSWRQAYIDIWRSVAQRYRGNAIIWGYDLLNEPREGAIPDGGVEWNALAKTVAAVIHSVDTTHPLIVEGAPDGVAGALSAMPSLPVPGAVFSFHMYVPDLFTHQGVYGNPTGVRYPGEIDGQYWDKAALRRHLQPVRDWQLRWGVPVYVGEFSVTRWAPDSSGYRYLADCISIFEEWGWGWAYHAFREWDGWSVEHDGNPENHQPAPQPTDRQLLLMEAFKKKGRP